MSWFSKFFSGDELKLSGLVFCLLITNIFTLLMYAVRGEISGELLTLDGYLIAGVTGLNGFNLVSNAVTAKNSNNSK